LIKFFIYTLTLIIFAYTNIVQAQNINDIELIEDNLPIIDFENTDIDLNSITLPAAPKCDNPQLIEKVIHTIQKHFKLLSSDSTMTKRKKALILSNVNGFEEVDIKKFTPKSDYNTANALITIKVNKHYKDEDFIICKQSGQHKKPLYLIIYPYMDNYKGHIINLEEYSNDYEKSSFIYP